MPVHLRPMTQSEYERFLEQAVPDYAADKVQSGDWPADEAHRRSADAFAALLPAGLETPGHLLLVIEEGADGTDLGYLWLALPGGLGGRDAFLYEFLIREPYRRKGLGTRALEALDELARDRGIESIGLHVFAHNAPAIALYEKMGYGVTDLVMRKRLAR